MNLIQNLALYTAAQYRLLLEMVPLIVPDWLQQEQGKNESIELTRKEVASLQPLTRFATINEV